MTAYQRYRRRLYALLTCRLYGIPDNYATGWTTGDVDFY